MSVRDARKLLLSLSVFLLLFLHLTLKNKAKDAASLREVSHRLPQLSPTRHAALHLNPGINYSDKDLESQIRWFTQIPGGWGAAEKTGT